MISITIGSCLRNLWSGLCHRRHRKMPAFEVTFSGQQFPAWKAEAEIGDRVAGIPSMLSSEEIQLLYWATKNWYTGRGIIADCGPFLGGSTAPLCLGLQDNQCTHSRVRRVHSFDRFVNDAPSFYGSFWAQLGETVTEGGSFLPIFRQLMSPFSYALCIWPGDFCKVQYDVGPIEILFVDLAKSWELNAVVVSQFFPHLLPKQSLLIQQDYLHWQAYWLVITMWYFREYFTFRGKVDQGSSVLFEYTRKIPDRLLRTDLKALPREMKRLAFETELQRIQGWQQTELLVGYIRMLLAEGDVKGAQEVYARIPVEAFTHPVNLFGLTSIPRTIGTPPPDLMRSLLPDFDESVYLELNPDVADAGISGALHYLAYGRNEQRRWQRGSGPILPCISRKVA